MAYWGTCPPPVDLQQLIFSCVLLPILSMTATRLYVDSRFVKTPSNEPQQTPVTERAEPVAQYVKKITEHSAK